MIRCNIPLLTFLLLLTTTISCVQSVNEKGKKRSHKIKPAVLEEGTEEGKTLFIQYCSACHGNDGKKGVNGAKDLTVTKKGIDKIIKRINEGKGNIPGYKETFNNQQVTEISKYVWKL
ncbi:mono/diheme cytochrome c family protein [Pedobacter sp. CG_S7]|uniref:c-type cytochrome n=1 Tax=Pedobacter sp. CG_S7 TaxID=3143930 RepID=UPI003398DA8E